MASCFERCQSLQTQKETSAHGNYTTGADKDMAASDARRTLPGTRVCGLIDVLLWKV